MDEFSDNNPELMSAVDLASRCKEQTERYAHREISDARYCFYLFRRLVDEDPDEVRAAQVAIMHIYFDEIQAWVRKHEGALQKKLKEEHNIDLERLEGEFCLDVAIGATERFFDKFTFSHWETAKLKQGLVSVLGLWKLMVHHRLIDDLEKVNRDASAILLDKRSTDETTTAFKEDVELGQESLKSDYENQEIARQAWVLILKHCRDDRDKFVAYDAFVLLLPPRTIFQRHLGLFKNIGQIHVQLRRLRRLLRRDNELRQLLNWPDFVEGEDDEDGDTNSAESDI